MTQELPGPAWDIYDLRVARHALIPDVWGEVGTFLLFSMGSFGGYWG